MKKVITLSLLVLLGTLAVADSASAQWFRRVWERRKAELHYQLSDELTIELGCKLDKDLAREMKTANQNLHVLAEAMLKAESAKLQTLVQTEMNKMRQQAARQIAAESKKLQDQTAAYIKKKQAASLAQIAAAAKTEAVKLRAENKKQVEQMFTSLQEQFAIEIGEPAFRQGGNCRFVIANRSK